MNVVLWHVDSFGHLACISLLKGDKNGIFELEKMVELRRIITYNRSRKETDITE